ncbi:hypothetical protein P7C71_g4698, partial [Lecanoromycetidae sp. Uapishka_2]
MVTNDLYGKPFQLKFVRPAQMLLFANAVCDPPLGQVTVVPYGETVRFTVLLESSRSFPEQPWEAILWHNGHENREWPVSGVEDVLTVFKPDGQGNVVITARNERAEAGKARVIAAVGLTFEAANAAVMYHARNIVRGDEYMSRDIKKEMKTAIENDVNAQWMENWYDGLTYCTWNALGQDLNEEKIYNALNILKQNDIKITNLIIDDNWQSLEKSGENQFQRGWTDFEANKEGFPHGLKHTVVNIRDQHPDILHIAVWHAIILFHTQLPLNKPRMMVRNSDDFFPGIPTSHPWHIFVNAHNSLLTSHLNILPDWDMFQTSHPYSGFHAAGRCISGGPIYFTDEPGEHNIELINAMTARTTRNKTIILRPPIIGKTVGIYTGYEEERLLKVGTFTGGTGGTGILALFNVSERTLSELVNINAFPGIASGQEYVIRAYTTCEISRSISLDSETPVVALEVEVKGYEILSAYRLHSVTLPSTAKNSASAPTKIAVLGLLGKMTGACAATRTDIDVNEKGRLHVEVALKALGVLGIYISSLHGWSIEDDILITIQGKVIPMHTVNISETAPVLEVDVETAWNEMELQPGWANEVGVEVFIHGSHDGGKQSDE